MLRNSSPGANLHHSIFRGLDPCRRIPGRATFPFLGLYLTSPQSLSLFQHTLCCPVYPWLFLAQCWAAGFLPHSLLPPPQSHLSNRFTEPNALDGCRKTSSDEVQSRCLGAHAHSEPGRQAGGGRLVGSQADIPGLPTQTVPENSLPGLSEISVLPPPKPRGPAESVTVGEARLRVFERAGTIITHTWGWAAWSKQGEGWTSAEELISFKVQ